MRLAVRGILGRISVFPAVPAAAPGVATVADSKGGSGRASAVSVRRESVKNKSAVSETKAIDEMFALRIDSPFRQAPKLYGGRTVVTIGETWRRWLTEFLTQL